MPSYVPNEQMIANAKRGLELREKYGRGGLDTQEAGKEGIGSGVARARDIADGKSLPMETVRRMKAFFDRHERNKDTPPEEGNGKIAWLLWGGDAGRTWAERIVREDGEGVEKCLDVAFHKSDAGLGLVFGWAVVSSVNGEPYYDLQGDHATDDFVLTTALDYANRSRVALDMHTGEPMGDVPFVFPMTEEVKKAFGIECSKTGLIIAMKPSPEVLEKFKNGEYTGFSIGGRYGKTEYV